MQERRILEENLEKEISFLTITDREQDHEKNQGRHPICPSGVSDFPPLPAYNTRAKINEMLEEESKDILEENVEKGIASLTITDCEQDQAKTQGRGPTCPSELSEFPPLPAYNTRAKIN